MDATPALQEIGRRLQAVKLEAVLIGNAAAALRGAPVTTVDFDFLFRKTSRNLAKLETFARDLRATVLRPYYPASDLFRVVRDADGLQVVPGHDPRDPFVRRRSGSRLRHRNRRRADLGASLSDVIRSKRAAKRPRGLAVIEILEMSLEEASRSSAETSGARKRK